jgi:hypothetical protein
MKNMQYALCNALFTYYFFLFLCTFIKFAHFYRSSSSMISHSSSSSTLSPRSDIDPL